MTEQLSLSSLFWGNLTQGTSTLPNVFSQKFTKKLIANDAEWKDSLNLAFFLIYINISGQIFSQLLSFKQPKCFFFYCYLQTTKIFFLQINIFMLYASLKEFDKVKCGTITALSNISFFHCGIYVCPVKYRNSIKRFFPHVKTLSANRDLLSAFPTHVACPLKASVHTP